LLLKRKEEINWEESFSGNVWSLIKKPQKNSLFDHIKNLPIGTNKHTDNEVLKIGKSGSSWELSKNSEGKEKASQVINQLFNYSDIDF
jgi:hypothetical protein